MIKKTRLILTTLLLVCTSLISGCSEEPQSRPPFKLAGDGEPTLPAFTLPDLEGAERQSKEWQGKVMVVNYWATWCPPCREEMPRFIKLQKQLGDQGLAVVGIAIDNPSDVIDFVDVYEINFPVLIGSVDGIKLSSRMGNRFESLPFTAIYDRNGNIQFAQAGEVSMEQLEKAVKPLL